MTGRIHDRYLLKQFVRIFFISLVAFTTIYITINTFEEIDNFIDNEASLVNVARYYFYSVPFILTYIIPISLLLATIFSMGVLSRRNELTAFIASGVSLLRLTRPIILTAIAVSVFSTFFNDYVVPRSLRKSKEVKDFDIEGRAPLDPSVKDNFHYLGQSGYIYLARRYNHRTETLLEVVLQKFEDNTLRRRVDAKRAKFVEGTWVFYDGFDRGFEGTEEIVRQFDVLALADLKEQPGSFIKRELNPENMNFFELSEYIDKVRNSGGNTERYLTDLYFKLSYPLAGAIFVLLGIAFASGKRKQSMATGFGLTLGIAFLYYGLLRVGQTLGYEGVVPPWLAAELGNILFLGIAVIFLAKANQ